MLHIFCLPATIYPRLWTSPVFHHWSVRSNVLSLGRPFQFAEASASPITCYHINLHPFHSSVQFSSFAQSCPTLCNPMNRSMPGLPVHHRLPEFTQTHAHRVRDAIQPAQLGRPLLLLPPIPPSIRVFSNESTLRMRWPKYWSFSFSIIPSLQNTKSSILSTNVYEFNSKLN